MMTASLTYRATFGLETRTIEIERIAGAGGEATWNVFVDRYFVASIQMAAGEIRVRPLPRSWLSGDDVAALIEVMEPLTETLTDEEKPTF
ncbi:MAG TPA: hypothetical protein VGM89_15560 [Puia sp.]|jgi:hypothetical protein